MYLPGSLGLVLPRTLLDPIDESIFQPDIVPATPAHTEAIPVGVNLGTVFTTSVIGDFTALCYYRATGMAASGTLSLWNIANFTDVLLVQVNFTGHSGTGWRTVTLPTPIKSNPAAGYLVSLWTPADGSGNCTFAWDIGYFTDRGRYSENNFLYAMVSNSQTDIRGFMHWNGLLKVGAFARPDLRLSQDNYWLDVVINARPTPIPPLPPVVIKWPIPEGYPDLDNTGPDPDTVFTVENEDVLSTADGQIIEDRDVQNAIIAVRHNNVTVRNCKVRGIGPYLIYIYTGTTGALVEDCEIDGIGRNNLGTSGVACGGSNVQILRNNIYRVENGISCFTGSPMLVKDNFIHNLRAGPGGPPHYDSIQCDGTNDDLTIEHNTIFNENGFTACIMIDNGAGSSDNILVRDNYLAGAGYCCYCVGNFPGGGVLTNVVYLRNIMRPGGYGYFAIQDVDPPPTMQGNQFMAHGSIFDAPPTGGFVAGQIVPECFLGLPFTITGSIIGETVPPGSGLTLGLSFTPNKAGQITGLNVYRPGNASATTAKIGLWRWLGTDKTGGVELIGSQAFENVGRKQWVGFAFDTPLAVLAGENLLIGLFIPRGADGKVWYASQNGFYADTVMSQWGTLAAFNDAGTPINGFLGCNGMYAYAADLTAPVNAGDNGTNYYVDPVFSAAWS